MKPLYIMAVVLAAIPPAARAKDAEPRAAMRDAATHDQLVLTYRQAAQEDPTRKLKSVKGADPSLVNQPKDILSESDILCYGGMATLVPKKAVLHIPKNLADRLKFQPGSKIQSWLDFYALNRSWITTVEVTRVQAEGNTGIAKEVSDRVGKSANLVVATYQGGPISVLPPKVKSPENPAGKSSEKSAEAANSTEKQPQ